MYDNTFGEWVCGECGWWPWGLWLCDDDRGPQSTQSVPRLHTHQLDPGPPSSQSPSEAQLHVFEQVCPTVPRSWRRTSRAPRDFLANMVLLQLQVTYTRRPPRRKSAAPSSQKCVCEFKTGPHSTAALMQARGPRAPGGRAYMTTGNRPASGAPLRR